MRSCVVCGQSTESEPDKYCGAHRTALDAIMDAYKAWSTAYGGVSKEEFLRRLSKLPDTGNRIKELSSYLLNAREGWFG